MLFDTTPKGGKQDIPAPEAKGTLMQQDKLRRAAKVSPSIVAATEKMNIQGSERVGELSVALERHGRSMSDCLADVTSFNALIDDRAVYFSQLRAQAGDRLEITCKKPPAPQKAHPSDRSEDKEAMRMIPTASFMRTLARYVNDRTYMKGVSGVFLDSLRRDGASLSFAEDTLNHMFRTVQDEMVVVRDGKPTMRKVMLRMLRPDIRPRSERRWPKYRSCRALLHVNYRDDIGHEWLMRQLADMAPTAKVAKYYFDGDLLRGAVMFPETTRAEKDSEYGGGVFFFSGEVGNRRCGAIPFIYRAASSAVTLYGKPWGVTHSGRIGLDQLAAQLSSYVHDATPLVTTAIDKLLESKQLRFATEDPFVVERLLIALGASFSSLSMQDLRLWRIGVDVERKIFPLDLSVFTLQNGLTRMSRACENPIRQIQLDMIAGSLLDQSWEKIVHRAQTVSDEQVHKTFRTGDE